MRKKVRARKINENLLGTRRSTRKPYYAYKRTGEFTYDLKSRSRKREFRKISFTDLMAPVERRGRDRSPYSAGTKAPRRLQRQQSLYGFYGEALCRHTGPSNVQGHHPWTILTSITLYLYLFCWSLRNFLWINENQSSSILWLLIRRQNLSVDEQAVEDFMSMVFTQRWKFVCFWNQFAISSHLSSRGVYAYRNILQMY